jgi:hypothetical protein
MEVVLLAANPIRTRTSLSELSAATALSGLDNIKLAAAAKSAIRRFVLNMRPPFSVAKTGRSIKFDSEVASQRHEFEIATPT